MQHPPSPRSFPHPVAVISFAVVSLSSSPAAQDEQKKAAEGLERGIAIVTKQTARTRANTEMIRARCSRDERAGKKTWRKAWASNARVRQALHRRFRKLTRAFHEAAMRVSPGTADDRKRIAGAATSAIRAWVRLGEPAEIAIDLRADDGRLARLLRGDASTRRRLLTEVADRLVATPGVSDLDVLCSVTDWSALCHDSVMPQKAQLDAVSADLVLVLTDRNAGGVLPGKAGYYKPGRFTSRGFAQKLRDDSDQVRHFAWAFRLFALSTDANQTEMLLRFKEERDRATRKLPLNEADLRLNKVARHVIERIRDTETPIRAAGYAKLIRRELGNSRK